MNKFAKISPPFLLLYLLKMPLNTFPQSCHKSPVLAFVALYGITTLYRLILSKNRLYLRRFILCLPERKTACNCKLFFYISLISKFSPDLISALENNYYFFFADYLYALNNLTSYNIIIGFKLKYCTVNICLYLVCEFVLF